MPIQKIPAFDYGPTLNGLAGVTENRLVDEMNDDEDADRDRVVYRRGDQQIPVARPIRVFYFGDRNLFNQEARRFGRLEKVRILNTYQFL